MSVTTPELQELNRRSGDGLTVRMLWDPTTGAVLIQADDVKTGAHFDVPVPAGVKPQEVFTHPFAYGG